jgi:hypothetical protein
MVVLRLNMETLVDVVVCVTMTVAVAGLVDYWEGGLLVMRSCSTDRGKLAVFDLVADFVVLEISVVVDAAVRRHEHAELSRDAGYVAICVGTPTTAERFTSIVAVDISLILRVTSMVGTGNVTTLIFVVVKINVLLDLGLQVNIDEERGTLGL